MKALRVKRVKIFLFLLGILCTTVFLAFTSFCPGRLPCPSSLQLLGRSPGRFFSPGSGNDPLTTQETHKQVLLVTYGRSGSTFTSAIISRHPGVFFTSEPLHAMPKDIYDPVISNSTQRKAIDTIISFLSCNFLKVDPKIFKSEMFLASSSTKDLYTCLREKKTGYEHVSCLQTMWKSCLDHPIRLVKTIRFRVSWIADYMRQNPGLKVLFLVRDFRPTIYSHARVFKTFNFTISVVPGRASALCGETQEHLKELLKLKELYPDRIKGVRYEDGTLDPLTYAKNIYDFIGLNFDNSTEQYVKQITQSKKSSEVVSYEYGVERKDSVATMNKWRKSVDFDIVHEIDKQCQFLYETLGYKAVNSEKELLSDKHSLVAKPSPGGIF